LLVAVVIDRKIDQAAETGFFEQIFKQVIPKTPAYMGKYAEMVSQ
jgi:tubulin monoglycylase TTLL3/8